MKIIFTSVVLFIVLCASSQKIEDDKIDDFNGSRQIRTSSVQIKGKNILSSAYVSVSASLVIAKIDTAFLLYFSFKTDEVAATNSDGFIYLKFSDNSVLKLQNRAGYNIESSGGFLSMYALLTGEDISTIRKSDVVKIRFDTTDGYIEQEIDGKKIGVIKNCVGLIDDYKL